MATKETPRALQVALAELTERVEALEQANEQGLALAAAVQQHAPTQRTRKPNGEPRWLPEARFESACKGNCGGRVQKGERAYYVPGVGTYHQACAPAGAKP